MPQRPSTDTLTKADAPVEAFRFAADFKPSDAGADGTVPFTSLARTGNPVVHWYWGPCIHDFAGMTVAPTIPVDWAHEDDEALGLINSNKITAEGLECSGLLTPFKDGDKASEVIFKSQKGVPYQSSIYFDPWSCVVEDVPSGMSTSVNGKTVNGPLAVFRQWKWMGLAVCLYGVDDGTNVAFSKNLSGKTVAVTRFSKGQAMTDPATTGTETATEETETTVEATTDESTVAGAKTTATATEETEGKPPAAATSLSRKDEGKRFLEAFGDNGATLFTQGYSFEEAGVQNSKLLQDQVKQLQGQLSKQASGGSKPASFSGGSATPLPGKFSNLGPNIGRFAAGIKLPGQPAPTP